MRRTYLFVAAGVLVVALGAFFAYRAQMRAPQAGKTYKIGILVRGSGYDPAIAGFKQRMEELGYRQGKDIVYDVRFVSDKNKLQETVRQLLAEKVDLINTYSTPATAAAITVTAQTPHPTPIVFGSVGDPLLLPGVQSIEHPGGNATGVTSLSTDLTSKRLELLKEMDPAIRRVAMPRTAEEAGDAAANKSVAIAQAAAKDLGVVLTPLPVRSAGDNARAAAQIERSRFDGIIVGGDSLVWGGLDAYIKQAITQKLPLAVFSLSQVQQGGLLGFGPDYAVSGKQSADVANKILRGGDPAAIPIQVPEKLIFVINLDTARAIGARLDPAFVKKADLLVGREARQ